MKLSTKIQKCELSPIRKYTPYAAAACTALAFAQWGLRRLSQAR